MKATRRTQPYRKGRTARPQGPAMKAMRRGRPAYMAHPLDTKRRMQRRRRTRKRRNPLLKLVRPSARY